MVNDQTCDIGVAHDVNCGEACDLLFWLLSKDVTVSDVHLQIVVPPGYLIRKLHVGWLFIPRSTTDVL